MEHRPKGTPECLLPWGWPVIDSKRGRCRREAALPEFLGYVPDHDPGKAPTGPCECERSHWRAGDGLTDRLRVTCLNCGNHWWSKGGHVVDGPPFTPYTEILATIGSLSIDHVRRPPVPGLPPGKFRKNIKRWNYWSVPALNPWAGSVNGLPGPYEFQPTRPDEAAHAVAERFWGERHASGDRRAIFKYVDTDALALRSPWVISQIEQWRADGEQALILLLMRRYSSNAGKTSLRRLVAVIRKDQAIFRAAISLYQKKPDIRQDEAVEIAAKRARANESTVKLVYRHYRPLYDSVVPQRFTTDQFFAELHTIAERIAAAG